ncbi:DUF2523 domain-containing protein [Acinetobacter nosocomialis]|uniref:DUF2523 family protein n=1 Tax=Acinetobacter nosocomialis TaxID=106654 RepID=UPI001AE84401|nr:DUF2523 family protein [Acinetobacter nosocomialis]MBP1511055.1 DUF2523 domain-containing protein [Acinetobacter nosocomialis]
MPAVLIAIASAVISSLLARLLLGAGLSIFTYSWINDLVASAQSSMMGLFNNIPASIFGLISILQIPQALSVLMSAIGIASFIRTSKIFIGKAH